MGQSKHTVHLLTTDESLVSTARAAVAPLAGAGWSLAHKPDAAALETAPPAPGDLLLVDHLLRGTNAYELCRRLAGRTRCRTYVVVDGESEFAEPIAHFCGATGALTRPLDAAHLRAELERTGGPRPALPSESRGGESGDSKFPEALLRDVLSGSEEPLIGALTDPETGLFNFAFLKFKLVEEVRRATRFRQPLSCVMLGFESEASDLILKELAGIFLDTSRDTDLLGRFDVNSFLFLLPNTGLDGARIMAHRVQQLAQERNLRDLVGDRLQIAVGISFLPHPDVRRPDDLFQAARDAFENARTAGGGVVCA